MIISISTTQTSTALIQDPPSIKEIPILEIKPEYSEDEVKTLTNYYGEKYGVNPNIMLNVIRCETHFRNKQSDIYSNGVRENSWGISQFHLPSAAYRDWETDRKSTRLNSSHSAKSRMPSSA